MSRPKNKQDKDTSPPNASFTMADISSLLEEHRKSLASDFRSSFETLSNTLDNIHTTVVDHGQRIDLLENNANEADRRLDDLEKVCSTLQRDNEFLREKLADLEGRSRRQNIRIVGLAESIDGARPTDFFAQLLVEVLGKEVLPSAPELDRAHRSLVAKPGPRGKPRPVIIRLHRYQVKDQIIREVRKRGNSLSFNGHSIRIYEDYTCLLYTSPSPRDRQKSRMPSSA